MFSFVGATVGWKFLYNLFSRWHDEKASDFFSFFYLFIYLFIYFFEVFKNFGIIVFNMNSRTMMGSCVQKKYFVFQLLRFLRNKLFNIFSLDFMSLWSLILATHHLKKSCFRRSQNARLLKASYIFTVYVFRAFSKNLGSLT